MCVCVCLCVCVMTKGAKAVFQISMRPAVKYCAMNAVKCGVFIAALKLKNLTLRHLPK